MGLFDYGYRPGRSIEKEEKKTETAYQVFKDTIFKNLGINKA